MLANGVELTASAYTDLVQEGLEAAQNTGIGFETAKSILSFGGRFDVGDTPQEIAEEIADNTGVLLEFTETLPFMGKITPLKTGGIKAYQDAIKYDKQYQVARRNNVGGAMLATQQAREEARIEAAKIAKQNPDIKNKFIIDYEINTGARNKDGKIIDQDKIISIEDDSGNLTVDYDLARKASRKTRNDLFEGRHSTKTTY